MSLNDEISELFHGLAALMELKGENLFKVIAFQKVARIIRESNIDLKKCMEEGKLCDIEGIGKGSQQIIEEYINTGKSSVFEEVAATVPKGLVPLLSIEGLGPKTINLLWKERNITSLDELEKSLTGGALEGVRGIGAKKIETIRAGIEAYRNKAAGGEVTRRAGIMEALVAGEELIERVRKLKGIRRAEIAGSLRRRRETIADIDFVGAVKDMSEAPAIMNAFVKLHGIVQTTVTGPSKTSVKLANGMHLDPRHAP